MNPDRGVAAEMTCGCFLQSIDDSYGTLHVSWSVCEEHSRKTIRSGGQAKMLALLFTAHTASMKEVEIAPNIPTSLWLP